jgi:hypothetical protein
MSSFALAWKRFGVTERRRFSSERNIIYYITRLVLAFLERKKKGVKYILIKK